MPAACIAHGRLLGVCRVQPSRDVDMAAVVAVAAASLLLTLLPAAARPQVWRLVSNFTFLGKPSLGWLFQLVWL